MMHKGHCQIRYKIKQRSKSYLQCTKSLVFKQKLTTTMQNSNLRTATRQKRIDQYPNPIKQRREERVREVTGSIALDGVSEISVPDVTEVLAFLHLLRVELRRHFRTDLWRKKERLKEIRIRYSREKS